MGLNLTKRCICNKEKSGLIITVSLFYPNCNINCEILLTLLCSQTLRESIADEAEKQRFYSYQFLLNHLQKKKERLFLLAAISDRFFLLEQGFLT